jgi:hypothetical protein
MIHKFSSNNSLDTVVMQQLVLVFSVVLVITVERIVVRRKRLPNYPK